MKLLCLDVPGWKQFDGLIHGFLGRVQDRGLPSASPFRLSCNNHEDLQAIRQNWCDLKQALGLPRITIVTAQQVHGNTIVEVSRATDKQAGVGDGLMTGTPNLCVGVMAADCVPLLFVEPVRRIAAAVHAGWRGTAAGIAPLTVTRICTTYQVDPGALHVAMGPSIGPCCYEVGPEVEAQIALRWSAELTTAWRPDGTKGRLDLRALNEAQLLRAGVPRSQIRKVGPCTACNVDTYFSYRKEGRTGHQLSFIGWRP